mmetsp:Transcript_100502/g.251922  ORF Transcript_100502/g.251922 Transcript_100502/m.251922 type:complete len:517 (-) Transcript_100502:319-1869(-)
MSDSRMGVGFFLIGQDSDPERVGSLQEVPPSPTSRAQRLLNVRRVLIGSTIAVVGLVVVAVSRQVGQASAEVELSSVVGLSKEIADGEEKTTKKAECRDTEFGDKCWTAASWAKSDGIYAHPEWYPDLTPQSSIFKFQAIVHKFSPKHCPNAPCSKGDDHPQTHQASPPAATAPPHPQPTAAPPPQPAAAPVAKPQEKPVQIKYLETKVNCSSPLVPVSSKSPTGQLTMTCGCPPPQVLDKSGGAPRCLDPAGPSQMTFYMYRAQGKDEYPVKNVNLADLAGVMWYLQREVVGSRPRKFHIERIIRYKVTMKNTDDYFKAFKKQFGPFVAFDEGSARGRSETWEKYGFVVGCQLVDPDIYSYVPQPEDQPGCYPKDSPLCTSGKWYSLPGPCPEEKVDGKTPECIAKWPGGGCPSAVVTGAHDCTYWAEFAGQIMLDDLEGVGDYNTWWITKDSKGGTVPNENIEYSPHLDRGIGMTFWDNGHSVEAGRKRMDAVVKLFKEKFPAMPERLPEPPCF